MKTPLEALYFFIFSSTIIIFLLKNHNNITVSTIYIQIFTLVKTASNTPCVWFFKGFFKLLDDNNWFNIFKSSPKKDLVSFGKFFIRLRYIRSFCLANYDTRVGFCHSRVGIFLSESNRQISFIFAKRGVFCVIEAVFCIF